MKTLTVKDIRKILEDTLTKFYDFVDYGISSTKVMDRSKEYRIEFRIYDASFWMDVDLAIDSIHIGTRSFGDVDHIDSLQMWLSKPFEYDKAKFEFGWRKDLETFFDSFHEALLEKVEKSTPAETKNDEAKTGETKSVVEQCIDAVYGSAKIGESKIGEAKIGEAKTSIFNSLKDGEDEYI
jgi:hypothetical protein